MTITEADRFVRQFDVSRETRERLEVYAELLRKWTLKINLVAPSTVDALWSRHLTDSAQLFAVAKTKGHWVDLGSSGGLPGLVVSILTDNEPTYHVTLVEADQRKAAFLRTVVRELGLGAEILCERIESLQPQAADILSARALAPLDRLLAFADWHLSAGGQALFPKGGKVDDEIAAALEHWRFDCEKHLSITDANSTILSIGGVSRA